MIKRLIVIALTVIGANAMVADCNAETGKPIYVVDMQKVLTDSVIGKAARNNLEAEIKKSQGSLEKAKIELDTMKSQLEKQGALLSADATRDKKVAVEKKERDLARLFQDQREEIARKNNIEIGKVVEQIDKVVAELAKKNDYEFILEKDQRLVVYADKKYDLTDQIIEILDERKVGL